MIGMQSNKIYNFHENFSGGYKTIPFPGLRYEFILFFNKILVHLKKALP